MDWRVIDWREMLQPCFWIRSKTSRHPQQTTTTRSERNKNYKHVFFFIIIIWSWPDSRIDRSTIADSVSSDCIRFYFTRRFFLISISPFSSTLLLDSSSSTPAVIARPTRNISFSISFSFPSFSLNMEIIVSLILFALLKQNVREPSHSPRPSARPSEDGIPSSRS